MLSNSWMQHTVQPCTNPLVGGSGVPPLSMVSLSSETMYARKEQTGHHLDGKEYKCVLHTQQGRLAAALGTSVLPH